ncbi:hypothetical protein JD502_13810 [Aeromonas veronii]|nr:hypothetical protein [Aeromonas veronii]
MAERVGVSLGELVVMEQPEYPFTHQQVTRLVSILNIQVGHLVD